MLLWISNTRACSRYKFILPGQLLILYRPFTTRQCLLPTALWRLSSSASDVQCKSKNTISCFPSSAFQFTDLRGLEKDIHTRIVSDVSTNCNCNFNSASLGEGNFLFGEGLTYRGVLFEMDGHYASSLVEMLSKSIHKQPLIKYQHGDIYLSISANCSVSIESLTDPEC